MKGFFSAVAKVEQSEAHAVATFDCGKPDLLPAGSTFKLVEEYLPTCMCVSYSDAKLGATNGNRAFTRRKPSQAQGPLGRNRSWPRIALSFKVLVRDHHEACSMNNVRVVWVSCNQAPKLLSEGVAGGIPPSSRGGLRKERGARRKVQRASV